MTVVNGKHSMGTLKKLFHLTPQRHEDTVLTSE